jgi:hypothetical protein
LRKVNYSFGCLGFNDRALPNNKTGASCRFQTKEKLTMTPLDAQDVPATISRKIVARYPLATIGSRTGRGGEVVIEGKGQYVDPYRIACVGDRVVASPQSIGAIVLYEGDAPISGLLQPSDATPITAMTGDRCER